MAVSSVHIELDKFFHETRGLNKDNCWEWFESFRNTLLYKGYEENPHPYAMFLLDEMECYSAYCAVGNIEGRVIAELERKKEPVTYETVYNICVEKKGEEYLNLKEKESRYIESHPEANKWKSNGHRATKSSSSKTKDGSKKDSENQKPQATEEASAPPAAQAQRPRRSATPAPAPAAAPKAATKKPGQVIWGTFENVYLSQEEFNELARLVGNLNATREMIDSLSAKLEDGSITSANHYATLTYWANYRKSHAEGEGEEGGRRYETVSEHNMRVSRQADEWIDEHFPKKAVSNG